MEDGIKAIIVIIVVLLISLFFFVILIEELFIVFLLISLVLIILLAYTILLIFTTNLDKHKMKKDWEKVEELKKIKPPSVEWFEHFWYLLFIEGIIPFLESQKVQSYLVMILPGDLAFDDVNDAFEGGADYRTRQMTSDDLMFNVPQGDM